MEQPVSASTLEGTRVSLVSALWDKFILALDSWNLRGDPLESVDLVKTLFSFGLCGRTQFSEFTNVLLTFILPRKVTERGSTLCHRTV